MLDMKIPENREWSITGIKGRFPRYSGNYGHRRGEADLANPMHEAGSRWLYYNRLTSMILPLTLKKLWIKKYSELKIRDYQDQLQQKVEHQTKRNPPDFSWFHRIAGFLPLKPKDKYTARATRGG